MGIAGGPNLNQDGLVFLYDVFDQDNSYKGEPATNYHDYDKSVMNQTGFNNWSCYDGSPPYHTWGTNQSRTFVTIPGPDGKDTPAMLYYNFNGGFYGPTDWGGIPAAICTTGNKITIQAWVKAADAASVGLVVSPYTYFNLNNGGVEATATNWTLTENWQLISHTHTMGSSGTNNNATLYFFTSNGSSPVRMYLTKTAILSGKGHAVQWLPGGTARSSTQGLLDISSINQIDISNASFNANAQITFDGTNDYINVPYNTSHNLTNQGTISVWINPASLTQGWYAGLVSQSTGGSANSQAYQLSWRQVSGGLFGSICNGSGTYNDVLASFPSTANAWYNIVFTWNGSLLSIYNNGILSAQSAQTIVNQVLTTDLTIGGYTYKGAGGVDEYFNGSINNVELFNRGFTAQEVLQNYNTKKSRFGLK